MNIHLYAYNFSDNHQLEIENHRHIYSSCNKRKIRFEQNESEERARKTLGNIEIFAFL